MTMSSIPTAASARITGPVAAILLAIALLYLGGFAEVEALHNGAHDARHSAAMPCH